MMVKTIDREAAEALEVEVEDGYRCDACDELHRADDIDPDDKAYECSSCGNEFLRSETDNYDHRCPECNKFAAKMADLPCPDCKQEMVGVEIVEVDGDLVEVAD
jgi:rubredoxin